MKVMDAAWFALVAALALPPQQPPPGGVPEGLRGVAAARSGAPVETEMRRVLYRAAPGAPILIHFLRGALEPTRPGAAPWLEDRESFVVAIDTARLSLDGPALAAIASLRLAGIGVRGLMARLGIALDDVMTVRRGRGIAVGERDIVLTVGDLVPPPRLAGRVVALGTRGGRLLVVFGRPARGRPPPLAHAAPPGRNYVCYHGGVLRFGKLTMQQAELEIADADESDLFDLSLADFNRQLVAGFTRNQADFGLKTTMPDYGDLPRPARRP